MSRLLIPTILCGGAGTRLWPVSRELHPKPFIRLADGQSLLQKAFLRAVQLPHVTEILTVTNRDLYFKIEDEYAALNQPIDTKSFILEPFGRNTAAAVALAALQVVATHGEEALLLVLAADHIITDQMAFTEAVSQAMTLAQQGKLVTFGIPPTRAETGYGYIETDGQTVKSFIEKPSLEKSQAFHASGRYLWNSGVFCFQSGYLLAQLQHYAPEVLSAAKTSFAAAQTIRGTGLVQVALDAATFKQIPDISIDYALLEKSAQVAVVACQMNWNDIGSWDALSQLETPDTQGNCVTGEALLHNTRQCYVHSKERLVGVIGVENLLIIDTPDALLVADRSSAQDVKHLVRRLKQGGHDAYKLHREVHRPWGTYTTLEDGPRFKIKRIVVKAGASLSLQMHHHRSEHWIVVSGMAKVTNGENELFVNTNESTFIPAGRKHRLENPGVLDLVMIEVQSGEYLGEDDIIRFEDKYNRIIDR